MIPLTLQLKNFVSYGPVQTIYFEPYQLICLSGKNGHGKSALLDALTWVLWGQARKTIGMNKADEAVLKLGETHMFVSLDFSCGDHVYRIRREYGVTAHKSQTELEFGIIDSVTGHCKALTDKTIRATQEKINTTIGLDYEAFVNSGFLRQGQSNEFSKKSPKDRKEILASILQLDQYEKIKKRAHEKARDLLNQKEQLAVAQTKLIQELARKQTVFSHLQDMNKQLENIAAQELAHTQKQSALSRNREQLEQLIKNREVLKLKLGHINQTIADHVHILTQESQQWRTILYKKQTAHNYTALEHDISALESDLQAIQAKAHSYMALKEQYLQLKEQEAPLIHKHQENYNNRLQELKSNAHKIQLEDTLLKQQIHETDKRLAHQNHQLEQIILEQKKISELIQVPVLLLETIEKQLDKRKIAFHKWHARAAQLTHDLKQLHDKITMAQHTENPVCPLCEQDLNESKKNNLLESLKDNKIRINNQLNRINLLLTSLNHLIIEQTQLREHIKLQQAERDKALIQNTEITKQLAKFQEEIAVLHDHIKALEPRQIITAQTLTRAHLALQEHEQYASLEHNQEYINLKKLLQNIQAQALQIDYKPQRELEIKEKLNKLHEQKRDHIQFLTHLSTQEERKLRIYHQLNLLRNYKLEKKLLEAEYAQLSTVDIQEQILQTQLQEITQNLRSINQAKEQIIFNKGSLEQEYKMLEIKDKEHIEQQNQIKAYQHEYEEYQTIASALGKDGVQALLIEEVIPEIEQEANRLLARLTDNQAHLAIESVRDLKSGGTKETLDIKISDAIGLRPYELFSGGEAFRIDFALRIAISKLLSRRAGRALQTLIIDEGFGSQDDEGLGHIMDAIHKIKDDFKKIIIVSHLNHFKDQFPVHFIIHKGPQGSQIKVIELD
jgi:DNA repair protein SbcC/Rad50